MFKYKLTLIIIFALTVYNTVKCDMVSKTPPYVLGFSKFMSDASKLSFNNSNQDTSAGDVKNDKPGKNIINNEEFNFHPSKSEPDVFGGAGTKLVSLSYLIDKENVNNLQNSVIISQNPISSNPDLTNTYQSKIIDIKQTNQGHPNHNKQSLESVKFSKETDDLDQNKIENMEGTLEFTDTHNLNDETETTEIPTISSNSTVPIDLEDLSETTIGQNKDETMIPENEKINVDQIEAWLHSFNMNDDQKENLEDVTITNIKETTDYDTTHLDVTTETYVPETTMVQSLKDIDFDAQNNIKDTDPTSSNKDNNNLHSNIIHKPQVDSTTKLIIDSSTKSSSKTSLVHPFSSTTLPSNNEIETNNEQHMSQNKSNTIGNNNIDVSTTNYQGSTSKTISSTMEYFSTPLPLTKHTSANSNLDKEIIKENFETKESILDSENLLITSTEPYSTESLFNESTSKTSNNSDNRDVNPIEYLDNTIKILEEETEKFNQLEAEAQEDQQILNNAFINILNFMKKGNRRKEEEVNLEDKTEISESITKSNSDLDNSSEENTTYDNDIKNDDIERKTPGSIDLESENESPIFYSQKITPITADDAHGIYLGNQKVHLSHNLNSDLKSWFNHQEPIDIFDPMKNNENDPSFNVFPPTNLISKPSSQEVLLNYNPDPITDDETLNDPQVSKKPSFGSQIFNANLLSNTQKPSFGDAPSDNIKTKPIAPHQIFDDIDSPITGTSVSTSTSEVVVVDAGDLFGPDPNSSNFTSTNTESLGADLDSGEGFSGAVLHSTTPDLFRKTSCRCGVRFSQTKIVGGTLTRIEKYPWMAGIANIGEDHVFCGGSVINDLYILTAAHCVLESSPSRIYVRLGQTSRYGPALKADVESITVHPKFGYPPNDYDIALIRLKEELFFSDSILPICLPDLRSKESYSDLIGVVAGWGRVAADGVSSESLREVEVNIQSKKTCKKTSNYSPKDIHKRVMCAAGKGKDSCQGDSGGPLMYQRTSFYEVIGLVSWGIGCAEEVHPGVYTRITSYTKWIQRNTPDAIYCSKETRRSTPFIKSDSGKTTIITETTIIDGTSNTRKPIVSNTVVKIPTRKKNNQHQNKIVVRPLLDDQNSVTYIKNNNNQNKDKNSQNDKSEPLKVKKEQSKNGKNPSKGSKPLEIPIFTVFNDKTNKNPEIQEDNSKQKSDSEVKKNGNKHIFIPFFENNSHKKLKNENESEKKKNKFRSNIQNENESKIIKNNQPIQKDDESSEIKDEFPSKSIIANFLYSLISDSNNKEKDSLFKAHKKKSSLKLDSNLEKSESKSLTKSKKSNDDDIVKALVTNMEESQTSIHVIERRKNNSNNKIKRDKSDKRKKRKSEKKKKDKSDKITDKNADESKYEKSDRKKNNNMNDDQKFKNEISKKNKKKAERKNQKNENKVTDPNKEGYQQVSASNETLIDNSLFSSTTTVSISESATVKDLDDTVATLKPQVETTSSYSFASIFNRLVSQVMSQRQPPVEPKDTELKPESRDEISISARKPKPIHRTPVRGMNRRPRHDD